MNRMYINKLLALLLTLALCAAPLSALAEEAPLEIPVEEQAVIELSEVPEVPGDAPADTEDEDSDAESEAADAESEAVDVEPEATDAQAEDDAEASDGALFAAEENPLLAADSALQLNAAELTLGVKEKFALSATLNGAKPSKVSYKSSDKKIASVSSAGKITAKKAGTAIITATSGDYAAACVVTVLPGPASVAISETKASLGTGETLQLYASVPEGAYPEITWKSSKAKVASVDENGLVTARSKGSATISAVACNGKKATCKVTVKPAPTGIRFDQASASVMNGQTWQPAVTVTGGSDEYTLSVEGDAVTASGRSLTAVEIGEAVITAATYNGHSATMKVAVMAAPKSLTLAQATYVIGVKDALTLEPIFDEGAAAEVRYSSSNAKVAAVTAAGVVTGKKAGKATITLSIANGLSTSCEVQVCKAPSKVTLSQTKLNLSAEETVQLEAKLPENSMSTLTWKSDHPGIASVDAEGRVTGLAKGSAKITVTTANNKKATCKVKVVAPPTRLTLSTDALSIDNGDTAKLSWTLDTGEGEVALAIADTDIAELGKISGSKVTIKAKAVGETELTASTFNGLTAVAKLTVLPVPTYLDLNPSSVELGVGQTYAIVADTDAASLSYATSKKSVATVSEDGVVTAVKAGSAKITVKTSNGIKEKLTVKVIKPPTSIKVSPASLSLECFESEALKVTVSGGSTVGVSYTSSDPEVAEVSDAGVVTGMGGGEAVITAETFNGLTAQCRVTVTVPADPPSKPTSVRVKTVNATTLTATWSGVAHAMGYNLYLGPSSDPFEATLFGSYDGATTSATLMGVGAGSIWHVFITAYNDLGETALKDAAHALARTPSTGTAYTVSLEADNLMLPLNGTRTLTAAVTPSGYRGGMTWQSNSRAVSVTDQNDGSVTLTAKRAGSARVSVQLDNGMSASAYVLVVDTGNLSNENFATVQKALLRDESLMDEDQGGNVIWSMIESKLEESNIPGDKAGVIVEKVKDADTLFRDIYVFAMGTYKVVGEATKDLRGLLLGVSQFVPEDNTLYLTKSASGTEDYTYTAIHEFGHAVDYNAGGDGLLSENQDAASAVLEDVRQLLEDRVAEAAKAAGVSVSRINGESIVNAVMDYRTLTDEEQATAGLTADEKKVYHQLTKVLASEMNATLPMNNGTMVWDAVEGATNFAVSGNYGHAYMLESDQYKESAKTYYYDKKGNPRITAEPWGEFFSANIMKDAATLAVNLAYLPRTCQYFAETLAPQILEAFKSLVKSK